MSPHHAHRLCTVHTQTGPQFRANGDSGPLEPLLSGLTETYPIAPAALTPPFLPQFALASFIYKAISTGNVAFHAPIPSLYPLLKMGYASQHTCPPNTPSYAHHPPPLPSRRKNISIPNLFL